MRLPGHSGWTDVQVGYSHVVSRGVRESDGRPVLLKRLRQDFPDPGAVAALINEYELLGSLDLDGVCRPIELLRLEGLPALLLEDVQGQPLADRMRWGAMSPAEFLPLAEQLAGVVARLHDEGILHRDLTPSNILLTDAGPVVVDFGLATRLRSLEPMRSRFAGTLTYMAPEQTGRTAQTVDERTDLYALGATFYEMLTGQPPFVASSAGELLHAHLARRPRPPSSLTPSIPSPVSQLVLRLLAKNPADRYQSAHGLHADLQELRRRLDGGRPMNDVVLGAADHPHRLLAPQRLHGRQHELERLRVALARAGGGEAGLVLIEGPAGLGKSALLRSLRGDVSEGGGLQGGGRFELLDQGVPFRGLAAALSEVLSGILASSEQVLARWRRRLRESLGDALGPVAELVPEIEQICLHLPPPAAAGPLEARNRLRDAVVGLIGVLARDRRPLVLLLDDLQWIDPASLDLLETLAGRIAGQQVLIVATLHGLEASSALARVLEGLAERGLLTDRIELAPLGEGAVAELVTEVLASPAPLGDLASAIARSSRGRPQRILDLLASLRNQGHLAPVPGSGWSWSGHGLHAPEVPSAAEAELESLDSLSEDSRQLLAAAAVLGSRFSLELLAAVLAQPRLELARVLARPLLLDLLMPVGDAWRLPVGDAVTEDDLELLRPAFRFSHDRIREAALALLGEDERVRLHLAVASELFRRGEEEALFEVVEQLRAAGPAVADWQEREEAIRMASQAADRALRQAAPEAALRFATAGLAWLGDDPWSTDSGRAMELARLASRAALAAGDPRGTTDLLEQAERHARDPAEVGSLAGLRVAQLVVTGEHAQAIDAGLRALELLGAPLDRGDLDRIGQTEREAVEALLERRSLAELGTMTDSAVLAEMQLLDALIPSTFFTAQDLFLVVILRMVRRTLEQGIGPHSGYPLVFQGSIGITEGRPSAGRELAEVGLATARERGDPGYLCRVLFIYAHHVNHWGGPLRGNIDLFREAERAGLQAGDHQWAGYAATGLVINLFPTGAPLASVLAEIDRAMGFLERTGNQPMIGMLQGFRQAARCLRGETEPGSFDNDGFDEAAFFEGLGAVPGIGALYRMCRLRVALLQGDLDRAEAEAAAVRELLPYVRGMIQVADHALLEGLVLAARAAEVDGPARAELLARARRDAGRLAAWATVEPCNFLHKQRLLEGAIQRAEGDVWGALGALDQAADRARKEGFLHDAALANELAGGLMLDDGKRTPANAYLQSARRAWILWGASSLAASLEDRFTELRLDDQSLSASMSVPVTSSGGENYTSGSFDSVASGVHRVVPQSTAQLTDRLDLAGILEASEAISGELVLEDLARRLLRIVVGLAGAERGGLVLPGEDGLQVHSVLDEGGFRELGEPLAGSVEVSPRIVAYAARTGELVVVDDARQDSRFRHDPRVSRRDTRSVLCIPALRRRRLVALLYLENDLVVGSFLESRARMLGLMATQIAIALENAALFERINEQTEQRLEAERALQQAQKMESIGRLAGGVAHDFNNLLGIILGWSRLLLDRDEQVPREALEQISRAAERGAELTRQLLAFSRSAVARPQDVYLDERLADVARMVERLLGDGYELSVEPPHPGLRPAIVDPALLEQVVVNLVVNARDAMPKGGEIRIRFRDLTVGADHAVLAAGDYVALEVQDEGHGIAPEVLPRIFEPFFTTKDQGKGSGLGLSTCLGIAQQSGGTLRVRSADVGTVFELVLPAGDDDAATTTTSGIFADPTDGAGRLVLLVEDDDTLRQLLATALRHHGFGVEQADSGEAAMVALTTGLRPAVLLTDLTMPGMDGFELIVEARRLVPGLPAAVLSGMADMPAPDLGLPRVPLLQKPIRPDDLASALARQLPPRNLHPAVSDTYT